MNQEEQWLLNEKYSGLENEAFRADLERLRVGEPLAYVIGHIPFLNCEIYLDSKPLIPRPETEFWTEKAIEEIKKITNPHVLDLCAGSGCIGVAVAKAIPEAQVTFAEIDLSHIPTIEKNIDHNFMNRSKERFEVIESDLFQNVSGKFDFILTNPPYIDPAIDRTEDSVKSYEPHLALYGGIKGFEVIEQIINNVPNFLNPNGQLWIEHEPEQLKEIQKAAQNAGFNPIILLDQYGVERVSVLRQI